MQYRNNIAKTSHAGMAIIIRRLDGIEEIIKSSCFCVHMQSDTQFNRYYRLRKRSL